MSPSIQECTAEYWQCCCCDYSWNPLEAGQERVDDADNLTCYGKFCAESTEDREDPHPRCGNCKNLTNQEFPEAFEYCDGRPIELDDLITDDGEVLFDDQGRTRRDPGFDGEDEDGDGGDDDNDEDENEDDDSEDDDDDEDDE